MDPAPIHNREIIVIGGSAGGIEPLQQIIKDLPSDLAASVFVVVHIGASSHLAEILNRAGAIPVIPARNGEIIRRGTVYVAVPDRHLLLHNDHMILRRGPRENLCRPALDPLFRSAACTFGGRVIGVVLSGALNDGTAGLRAIKRCGGLAIIQDPLEALVSTMPRSAERHVDVDHTCRAAEIGPLLARLIDEPAGTTPPIPFDIRLETLIASQEAAGMKTEDKLGNLSGFSCPECHGSLWEIEDGSMIRFRCHVGHAYTADAVLACQSEEVERTLWTLLRAHQERAALARRMAEQERGQNRGLAADLEGRARDYEAAADLVRNLLREGNEALTGSEASTRVRIDHGKEIE